MLHGYLTYFLCGKDTDSEAKSQVEEAVGGMPWAGGFGFFRTPRKAGCRPLHPVTEEGGGWESW